MGNIVTSGISQEVVVVIHVLCLQSFHTKGASDVHERDFAFRNRSMIEEAHGFDAGWDTGRYHVTEVCQLHLGIAFTERSSISDVLPTGVRGDPHLACSNTSWQDDPDGVYESGIFR